MEVFNTTQLTDPTHDNYPAPDSILPEVLGSQQRGGIQGISGLPCYKDMYTGMRMDSAHSAVVSPLHGALHSVAELRCTALPGA